MKHGVGSTTIVLLPPVGVTQEVWHPVARLLERDLKVVAVGLPGSGSPLTDGAPWTVERFTDEVERWLADHGLFDVHVGGCSLGAAVALELARRGLVASSTAFAPIGFWSPGEVRWAVTALRLAWKASQAVGPVAATLARRSLARRAALGLFVADAASVDEEVVVRIGRDYARSSLSGILPATRLYRDERRAGDHRVATTIAWGSRDRLLLPRQADRAQRIVPHARRVTLPGRGHVPMLDAPAEVASVLRAQVADAG
jgi:pimeloyl-ACP methyl ester carboxylesterase